MAVLTIRPKNQVTIPQEQLDGAGLRQGDPIQFKSLADGGIGIYPYMNKRTFSHRGLTENDRL